jgi:4-methyl-5(b-hydroxyethyl)-thiazole monophosphate biosynthesis
MKQTIRVLCLLGEGFEEIELITPVDILRRAGIPVVIASMGKRLTTGRCGIRVEADQELAGTDTSAFEVLLIPGGPGVARMREDGRAAALAREFHDSGRWLAAICAAPLILMDAGVLKNRRFTAYQSVRSELGGGLDERVVVDGRLITSRGAGTAMDFALALVGELAGPEAATKVASEIMA